ncbi:MAG TPA: FGGY-family carbohydrate kinase [Vicinamibacterales bacterium]|nr:FGGY-family carbohydrate kinase [Vicinamibacterales bacterium]
MALYLGLDSSTQSLSAVVIEISGSARRVVHTRSFAFDEVLPHYRTRHGVLPHDDPKVAMSPPQMWAEALDLMLGQLANDIDVRDLAAVSGSAQQHGSVFLNASATQVLASLDPGAPLVAQIRDVFSREESPIWMDSSTTQECAEITAAVGGEAELARRTGSRAFERFTGPQIRKFFKDAPAAYAATDRVHLVSSFLASLLAGQHAAIDTGDGSGMNLMDLASSQWWTSAVRATTTDLEVKLPSLAVPWACVGTLSRYWQSRYGYPAASVIVWSGDNPCSLIGTGLVREGRIAVSMGTSDTVFGVMNEPRVDESGTGHVFGSPTGAFMGLTVFQNGSLARERVRDVAHMTWPQFSQSIASTPPTAGGVILPWFEPEITPNVRVRGVRRYASSDDGDTVVRALVESQQIAMMLHSSWMNVDVDTIHATGGAAANREILQVMADVFGADVYQLEVANSAALGAALRAAHAHMNASGPSVRWEEVVGGFTEPRASSRIRPDAHRHAMYREWAKVYAACEAHALGRGSDPSAAIAQFRARFRDAE